MMTVAEVNNGPEIERGVGLLADFHGRPMINFRSQQNAFGNLALRHQAAIAPILIACETLTDKVGSGPSFLSSDCWCVRFGCFTVHHSPRAHAIH